MIIILNAPAGAGKDTIQQAIASMFETGSLSFKKPMFEMAHAILGDLGYSEFMDAYNDRNRKEAPLEILKGSSPRQFMIWISETIIKPAFGDKHFGNLLYDDYNVKQNEGFDICVVSDGGFPDETITLIEKGAVVKLFRMHRDGYSFDGDSRNYVHLPDHIGVNGYQEFDVNIYDGKPVEAALDIFHLATE